MTVIVRRPLHRVTIAGLELPNVISLRCVFGLDIRVSEAYIRLPSMPSWVREWEPVYIGMGPSPQQMYGRFAGYFVHSRRALYPAGVELVCYGPLILARQITNDAEHGTDLTDGGTGATGQAMVEAVLDAVGLTTTELGRIGSGRAIGSTGETLGTIAYDEDDDGNPIGPFTWRHNEAGLSFIERLEEVELGYRTYEAAGGFVVRSQIRTTPASTVAVTFTEGVDLFRADMDDEILEAKNYIKVWGYDAGDGPVYYPKSQANPLVKGGSSGYAILPISNEMIEKAGTADAGDGISCQEVAEWRLDDHNVKRRRIQFATHRGDQLSPGATYAVDSPTRLGITTERFWCQHLEIELSERNEFTQYLTVTGGIGSAAPVDPDPLADFNLFCETEKVVISGTETTIYVVHCRAIAAGMSGEISGYAWTATGGTPSSGSDPPFTTTYTDISGKSIGLQVTDENGKNGTRLKAIPAATSPLWITRKLYLAGKARAEVWTGAIWNTDAASSGDVLVASNGPIWGAGPLAMRSTDDLATSASESTPKGGVAITAIWIETDVSTSRIAVGLNDGSIALSSDAGATWSLKSGPDANPVLRIVLSRYNLAAIYVLTAAGYYLSLDNGAGWATLVAAQAGETFRDLCVSHTRQMIAMSGGRLLCDGSGTAQTIPTLDKDLVLLDPAISDIVAVTADIVEDRFWAYDSESRCIYHDSDGSTTLEHVGDLPAACVVQARGLWRDGNIRGLLYIAGGTGGAWKSVDGFASESGYYRLRQPGVGNSPAGADYRQIGADGLLSVASITPTTIVSSTDAKALSLWNGSGNDAPPSGWNAADFDDSAWGAAVEATHDFAPPSGSTAIWSSSLPQDGLEHCLTRQAAVLPAGLIRTATLTYRGDDFADVWINGVWVFKDSEGGVSGYIGPEVTINIDPAILIPGGTNLIAVWGRNGVAGSANKAYVGYKLVVS